MTTNYLIGNYTESEWASMEGFRHYEEGNYSIAAALFEVALSGGEYEHAIDYADICQRNLDSKNRPGSEAAKWYRIAAREGGDDGGRDLYHEAAKRYLIAAREGDGQAHAYLRSLSPDMAKKLDETPRELWVTDLAADVRVKLICS